MSKKKKKRTPSSQPKSPTDPPAEVVDEADASEAREPLWRTLASEPVAVGLALFVFFRPWRDGLTFPGFNAYFAFIVIVTAALWVARAVIRGQSLRFGLPLALMGAFLAVAYLTGFATIFYDATHRGLHTLTVYALLFLLATNGLRSWKAIQIVLVAVAATWLLSALWAIFHYFVMLRGMRQVLTDNPAVMAYYFGTTELTQELKDRLESNRAFGAFLFPNALGAFLALGIPFLATSIRPVWDRLRALAPEPNADSSRLAGWKAFGLGIAIYVPVIYTLSVINEQIGAASTEREPPLPGTVLPFVVLSIPAVLAAGWAGWSAHKTGFRLLAYRVAAYSLPLAVLASIVALWLSYSRGAAIGLLVGSTIGLLATRASILRVKPAAVAATIVLVSLGLLMPAAPSGAQQEWNFELDEPDPTPIHYRGGDREALMRERSELRIEGIDRGLEDLVDPTSLGLRASYWQVGLRIVSDNPLTGVGLGNFKIGYRRYQFLGAGDVEAAHNDPVEYFATTGLLGGGLFLAFWVYFAGSGFIALQRMAAGAVRLTAAGVYAGTLAFVVHSLVDFNFQNPGLGALVYLFAGLFYALTALELAPPALPVNVSRIAAIGAALIVAIAAGSISRVYLFDLGVTEGTLARRLYDVGDRKTFRIRIQAATTLFDRLESYTPGDGVPPYMALTTARTVIPDMAILQSVGQLRVQEANNYVRVLRPDEDIPSNALYFVSDMNGLFRHAVQHAEARIGVLKEWDSMYPHDPELASQIFNWYALLFDRVRDPAVKRRYAVEAEKWAKAAVDRSPHEAWWRLRYAQALWMRALLERGQASLDYYYEGLEQYETAYELYPRSAQVAAAYGDAMMKLGAGLRDAGRIDEGNSMIRDGQAMRRRADVLDRYKNVT